jgi:hypothetical protein
MIKMGRITGNKDLFVGEEEVYHAVGGYERAYFVV